MAQGANISHGRNLAIAAATGDVIASTDAGVRLEANWLELLVAPLAAGSTVSSAGFFVADPITPFEMAMGATVLPALEDVNPVTFLPSSRSVAFLKTAWAAAGGYPEWPDYCEDLIFDFRLQAVGGRSAWAPGAIAHFRPRSSLSAFAKQYYRYARGDGKANLWGKRHAARYLTYLVVLPALLAVASRRPWLGLSLLVAGGVTYCAKPYYRLRHYLPKLAPTARAGVCSLFRSSARLATSPKCWVIQRAWAGVYATGGGPKYIGARQRTARERGIEMELLKERILREGVNMGHGILKVDSFINHQVDPALMLAVGGALAARLAHLGANKIVTAEISGIAPALTTALALGVPVVYARKTRPVTMHPNAMTASAPSHTKDIMTELMISPEYLGPRDRCWS